MIGIARLRAASVPAIRTRRWGHLRLGILVAALFCGLAELGAAGWIEAKAWLAQRLLQHSWQEALAGRAVPPWPWADTLALARLRLPGGDVDLIVLAGATGRTLAFAPGHVSGTPLPGEPGNAVIAGHRDTHFRFLERLDPGDRLIVETAGGSHWFQVVDSTILDARTDGLRLDVEGAQLTLVTCYPFDAVAGGPLRYVVVARRIAAPDRRV